MLPTLTPQLLVNKEDSSSEKSLVVIISGKRVSHPSHTIKSILYVSGTENRFTVSYVDGEVDLFEADLREDIVHNLRWVLLDIPLPTAKKAKPKFDSADQVLANNNL